jgi:Zn-dependent protease
MQIELFLFQLFVFLFSIVIHEVSHGVVAEWLGDPTARHAGRLTLNPVKHIDPIGSVILPLVMAIPALFGGTPIIFGWAKPVPYNPDNLKDPKIDGAKIALAGPVSNLLIAFLFGLVLQNAPGLGIYAVFFSIIIYINILLAVFNLLPVPPLDGSKVLFAILPSTEGVYRFMRSLEQYGFLILIVLLFTGGITFIYPLIGWLYRLFVGGSFGA